MSAIRPPVNIPSSSAGAASMKTQSLYYYHLVTINIIFKVLGKSYSRRFLKQNLHEVVFDSICQLNKKKDLQNLETTKMNSPRNLPKPMNHEIYENRWSTELNSRKNFFP